MKIEFQKLFQGLSEAGLLNLSPADMDREQIEELCRLTRFCSVLEGGQEPPF